jgi:hypothetical protein
MFITKLPCMQFSICFCKCFEEKRDKRFKTPLILKDFLLQK